MIEKEWEQLDQIADEGNGGKFLKDLGRLFRPRTDHCFSHLDSIYVCEYDEPQLTPTASLPFAPFGSFGFLFTASRPPFQGLFARLVLSVFVSMLTAL